jgi:hypothetical protein
MTDQPNPRPLARTFVLRVVLDQHTGVHSQASEPGSADEWHLTAASLAELWRGLEERLARAAGDYPASSGDTRANRPKGVPHA